MTHIVAVVYDEIQEAGEAHAYDTLDEALDIARSVAGNILEHAEHLPAIPRVEVFEFANPTPVWDWCAPTF